MARYEHLPIYRAAFELAVHIEKIVKSFKPLVGCQEFVGPSVVVPDPRSAQGISTPDTSGPR